MAAAAAAPLQLASRRATADAAPPAASTLQLLETSPYVYVSPLRSDGRESRCHGEIWYAWLDREVVAIVSSEGWKARAIRSGLARARIWVGDHGRWKGWLGTNDDFRKAPHFDARGQLVKDDALLGRLMERYRTKYPDEIADWEPRMRSGHADGARILVRYQRLS